MSPHEHTDGPKDFFLRNAHARPYVDEEGRGEVMPPRVLGMNVPFAPYEAFGPLGDGIGDEMLEAVETRVRNHRTNVNFFRLVERRPDP